MSKNDAATLLSGALCQESRETLIKSCRARRDGLNARPPAAKAVSVAGFGGTAEEVPFQSGPWFDLIRGSLGWCAAGSGNSLRNPCRAVGASRV